MRDGGGYTLPKLAVRGDKGLIQYVVVAIKFFAGLGFQGLPGSSIGAQGAGQRFCYGRELPIGSSLRWCFEGLRCCWLNLILLTSCKACQES